MKKHFLVSIAFAFSILIFGTFSWAQCPEDTVDRGECDSLIVTCLDCEQTPGTGPWHVRFPLLVTHDQTDPDDSIAGFVIPISWTRTNPAAFCSLDAYWNTNDVWTVFPGFPRSIFRHMVNEADPTDTLMHNRMALMGADFMGREWDTRIVDVRSDYITDSVWARLSIVATGSQDQGWWEGDRVLLATLTYVIEDTMTICMDTTFWPPTNTFMFSRSDAKTYVPRDNLPRCFTVGPPPAPDFTIEASPDTQTVEPGQATEYTVTLTSVAGFDSPCTLTVTGLPAAASADFVPNPVTPTNTSALTITTTGATPEGTYTLTVTATELTKTQIENSTQVVLEVIPAANFTIALDPDSLEIQAGSSGNTDVNLTSLYGFASTCTLNIANLPTDASASFDPDTLTPDGTSNLQINTAVTTPAGVYTALVIATEMAKGIVDTAQLILNVTPPPDFTIEAEPETLDVWPGGSVDGDVILTSLYGFASPLDLSASGLPTDASAGFDPDPATPTDTSVMTITAGGNTPPGTYDITITADEVPPKGVISHSTQVVLVVHQPDFTIEADPETLQVIQGGQDSCEIILTSLYGFDSPCTLSVSGLPQDASGTFDPDTMVPTDTSTLSITVAETTPTGVHPLTVTAMELVPGKGQVEHSVEVVLVVNPPQDFTIEVLPDTLRMLRGTDSSYIVTLTSTNGFNSPCTLEVSGLPVGLVGTFDSPTLVPTDSTKLNISVPDTTPEATPEGFYPLTVTATEMVGGKVLQHSADVILVVTLGTWDFYLEAYPDSQWVTAGHDTTFEVVMFPNIGYTASCTLYLDSGLPPSASFSFDPPVIAPNDTSVLTISTHPSTPLGWYELLIRGIAIPKEESTTIVHLEVREETGVEDWADNLNTPKRFALFQNHPNPFNPETKISYYLPTASHVRLTVYNILGQKVRTLFDGHQDSGNHTVVWDGRRDDGTPLSSGIYFYRMQAGDFRETKKMSLMK
ncbi:MAG: FlgD immunoglobulin-like domain containing protein [Candidatus Zixiibacteriota bacterium]